MNGDGASSTSFSGRVAIVTGGGMRHGDGIGNGCAAAILLARAGARVAVVGRHLDSIQRTVDRIENEGGSAIALVADVTKPRDCRKMVQKTVQSFGRLDFLDNNVGIAVRGSVVDRDYKGWQKVMQTNVDSMFLTSKYAIPAMREGGGGAIVNIASLSALRPRGLTAYSASKGAVIALTRAMAVDHGPDGIRVNCVVPGALYTPMVTAGGMSDSARETRRKAAVLSCEGTGWDTAHAVRFLLSDEARYITGQMLVVDGGVSLRAPDRDTLDASTD